MELDRFLSARVGPGGVPAAAILLGPHGAFDASTWSVSLPEGETDPDVLASALLHENVHKEQFFLMWRLQVPQVAGPVELARRVGTADLAVAGAAWSAGALAAGSRESEAARTWWTERREKAEHTTRVTKAAAGTGVATAAAGPNGRGSPAQQAGSGANKLDRRGDTGRTLLRAAGLRRLTLATATHHDAPAPLTQAPIASASAVGSGAMSAPTPVADADRSAPRRSRPRQAAWPDHLAGTVSAGWRHARTVDAITDRHAGPAQSRMFCTGCGQGRRWAAWRGRRCDQAALAEQLTRLRRFRCSTCPGAKVGGSPCHQGSTARFR